MLNEPILIGPKKKIAFVCSGGAVKAGAFHLGVALALREYGFRFKTGMAAEAAPRQEPEKMEISTFVGSSAGSIIVAILAAGYSIENILNAFSDQKPNKPEDMIPKILPRITYWKIFHFRPSFGREQIDMLINLKRIITDLIKGNMESILQLRWLKMTGIFSAAKFEEFLREEVLPSNQFQDYLADLFIVATQLNHSRKMVFGKYRYDPPPHDLTCQYNNSAKISEACAASIALPIVFSPYPVRNANGQDVFYIDGEIRDTLSTHVAADSGADLVIASYTHQPYHYRQEIGSLTEYGISAILLQSIYLLIEKKINAGIRERKNQKAALEAVHKYCQEQSLPEEHRRKILSIMERELQFRSNVDFIYIHPEARDEEAFFGEHFTLTPKKMLISVKLGYRVAMRELARYRFADLEKNQA